jgi:hypothetical protein
MINGPHIITVMTHDPLENFDGLPKYVLTEADLPFLKHSNPMQCDRKLAFDKGLSTWQLKVMPCLIACYKHATDMRSAIGQTKYANQKVSDIVLTSNLRYTYLP